VGSAVKVYQVFCKGESKSTIEIQVFHEGGYYSAVMIPIASGDKSLMGHFQNENRNRQEVGKTIEEAVTCCEAWIKKHLCEDVQIRESRTLAPA